MEKLRSEQLQQQATNDTKLIKDNEKELFENPDDPTNGAKRE